MSSFKKTPKQKEAIDIISNHIETLLEGGSRSGKTFIEIYVMFARAIKYAGTDHLSVRAVFNDAKKALWYKTIPDVHKMCFPTLQVNYNKTDFFIEFPNGSRYWIGGLDNRERLEKVLGNEYATIHENEISQISYTGHSLLKTRLNPPKGVKPIMLLDQNPSHKRHWGYKIFHQGINPVDDTPIADMARYGLLKMNPADNLENISETYMDTLLTLSEQERKRFIDGEYTDIVGAIYNRFNDSMVITSLKPCDYYVVGVDLITYAAVLVGFLSNDVIVLDELGGHDLTAAELNKLIVAEWGKYRYKAYIDWNLSETGTREFDNSSLAIKGAGSVEAGINQIKQLMESKHFWIHEKCIRTRTEIEGYRRDDNGKIAKESDHFIDALRYSIYSNNGGGEVSSGKSVRPTANYRNKKY